MRREEDHGTHRASVTGVLAQTGGSFTPRGPVARELLDLWWLLLWLGVFAFVVFLVALVIASVRRRAPRPGPPEGRPESPGSWIIGGGVVMPVIVIAVVFGFTVQVMRDLPEGGEDLDAEVIEVVGHRWWWEFTYPEAGVTTANELHIPVGRAVELRLTSADVIHSFWVPELAGKLDLVPDGTNTLVLEASVPGEYRGRCAEFCGLQHTKMGFVVVAQPETEFTAWRDAQAQPAAEPATASARRGKDLFHASCASCHTVRGTPADGTSAPDLTHLASRRTLGAATTTLTRAHLEQWLTAPDELKSGTEMPSVDLPDEDLQALLDYLETLR